MSRWARTAGLVLMPVLLLSVALLGCSGDKKKGGDGKKEDTKKDDGEPPAGAMTPVKVGANSIAGTVKLKEGVEPDYDALNADLKKRIDKNTNRAACKEAYQQTAWIVDKSSRGVKNVAVWVMPEKETEFFDVKELAEKKQGFEPVVVLDQPHCHFEPRILVLFPGYVNPANPGDASSPNYLKSGQLCYAVNPETSISHNTKLSIPFGGGQDANKTLTHSTKSQPEKGGFNLTAEGKLKPYDLSKGPIKISCNIHDWMEGAAWSLPHPLGTTTNEQGAFKIQNVPDSGKVRIFVWHEKAKFVNKGGKEGEVIDVKDAKQDFTIADVK
ncbi:MAG: hypothetical protein HYS12_28275 [Planctomycetes bacterium]|nr:hypothetical protein [Planctomycetota bacterium]